MKPAPFRHHRPATLVEALATLADVGEDGKVLAGGQSLVPLLSMRLAAPEHVVDIGAVPALDGIEVTDDAVRVGALVRHADLEHHAAANVVLPLLGQALRHVAHPTIRNRGTVVGSLCHGDAAAELPAVLALCGGSVTAASTSGERQVPASELYVGPLETSLRPDELAIAAVFPVAPRRSGTAVVEVARRNGDYAVCGVVAEVRLDPDAAVERARVAYISVNDVPGVVDLTDAAAGMAARDDWRAVGVEAGRRVTCSGDIHASAGYRHHLVEVLTAKALAQAAGEVT